MAGKFSLTPETFDQINLKAVHRLIKLARISGLYTGRKTENTGDKLFPSFSMYRVVCMSGELANSVLLKLRPDPEGKNAGK